MQLPQRVGSATSQPYRSELNSNGMVCMDSGGEVVRPALLWNDTRSAKAATDLVEELGGPKAWADAVGVVPVAAVTASKLRWLADHEPGNADRTAAVCLPQ